MKTYITVLNPESIKIAAGAEKLMAVNPSQLLVLSALKSHVPAQVEAKVEPVAEAPVEQAPVMESSVPQDLNLNPGVVPNVLEQSAPVVPNVQDITTAPLQTSDNVTGGVAPEVEEQNNVISEVPNIAEPVVTPSNDVQSVVSEPVVSPVMNDVVNEESQPVVTENVSENPSVEVNEAAEDTLLNVQKLNEERDQKISEIMNEMNQKIAMIQSEYDAKLAEVLQSKKKITSSEVVAEPNIEKSVIDMQPSVNVPEQSMATGDSVIDLSSYMVPGVESTNNEEYTRKLTA